MKNLFMKTLLVLPILFLASCSDDDNASDVVTTKTFVLKSISNRDISGTAKFIKNEDNSTTVELRMEGTLDGGMHPAHIHYNTAVESGAVAITLGTVDGDTGFSTKTFSKLDNDTAITFEELLDFDGYINVHLSANELTTLVAQGDIGENELTGKSKVYPLNEVGNSNISGTATFYERANGYALATIKLKNIPDDNRRYAHIHMGSVANGPGTVLFNFNPIDAGISNTNVEELEDTTDFNYNDVQVVDGYIDVHAGIDDDEVVAQNNIGKNI